MTRQAPAFIELSAAIDFIAGTLESGDHRTLADACLTEGPDSLRAIELLARFHAEKGLRSLYAGKAFPPKETRFKLGGHGRELGHLHIDFVRTGFSWQLANIWQCR